MISQAARPVPGRQVSLIVLKFSA